MESRKSVRNLSETIHSLLGLKRDLTSTWVNSVCSIIKDLPPDEEPLKSSQNKCMNFSNSRNQDCDVDSTISKIQGDLATLNDQLNQLNVERRQALNDFLDLKGNIRVFCRIRPLIDGEKFDQLRSAVALDSSNVLLKLAENKSKRYSFDKVFDPGSSQDEVFREVEPVIKSAVDGYNACIFAYGQTGTGKTFTMEGTDGCPGVVPRAIEELFKQAADSNHTFVITFSMLEIYLGHLRDLLIPQMTRPTDPLTQCLAIQTDSGGGIEIENLVEIRVSDFNQANKLYGLGSRLRSTASTSSNITSSRSHCLIRISMTSSDATIRRRETNKIWMVDLGGSERVLKTKACGRRFEEGKAINLSLSALGDVMYALQRKRPHVPFRNSKLTQVLKDSLGEDSKTLMLVHVSPKEDDLCETLCSLSFATRVRSIHLGNEESTDIQLKKELAMAELLEKVKQLECNRQEVRKDIKKLNEGLDHLFKTKSSFDEHLEAVPIVPECNLKMEEQNVKNVLVTPQSGVPKFMCPTISSRRKSGMDVSNINSSHKKNSLPTRRRRTLSVRAESLTFPVKDTSEYGSECSIARTTCLADYETEYSQNASECDVKMVVFPEEKLQMGFARPKARVGGRSTEKNGNGNRIGFPECMTVKNWLQLPKKEQTTCTYARGSKRVLAIPLPENKNRFSGQDKADKIQQGAKYKYDTTKTTLYDNYTNKIDRSDDTVRDERFTKDMVTGDTFMIGCAGSKPTTPADMKIIDETPCSLDNFVINEDRCIPVYPPYMSSDLFIQNRTDSDVDEKLIEQALSDETSSVDSFRVDSSSYNSVSSSEIGKNNIVDEEFYKPVSKCELDIENLSFDTKTLNEGEIGSERKLTIDQNVQIEVIGEDSETTYLFGFPQYEDPTTGSSLHSTRSQRTLPMDVKDVDQEDSIMHVVESQENFSYTGILCLLGRKIQILYASALLGLGVQHLGFGHDFFHGLTL